MIFKSEKKTSLKKITLYPPETSQNISHSSSIVMGDVVNRR